MTSRVIFKKQKASDDFGHVAIQYFDGKGNKKVISLKIKILETYWDKNFNLLKQKFDRSNQSPTYHLAINDAIKAKINETTAFQLVTEQNVSFIKFFEGRIKFKRNVSTISVRNSVLKKLIGFKIYLKLRDIPFSIIDEDFLKEFTGYILDTKNSGTTAKAYLAVIKTVLNEAKKKQLYVENYNYFKDLDFEIIEGSNSALTMSQVQSLLDIPSSDKNFFYIQMFLASIFLHGIRVSDLLLMKNSNFKNDLIVYKSKKTGIKMEVEYDDKLVTILSRLYGFDLSINLLLTDIDKVLDNEENINNKNTIYGGTERLINHIQSLNKNDFMLKSYLGTEPALLNYNKAQQMTNDQYKAYIRLVNKYSSKLKIVAKNLKIDSISSHSARYTFANINLSTPKPDLLAVSRALGHKNLQTTQIYFNKNFGGENVVAVVKNFNDKFKL